MSRATLYGQNRVSEDQVRAVIPPPPTDSWNPMSHDKFLTTIDALLKQEGFSVEEKQFQLGYDNNRLFGVYDLNGDTTRTDYGLSIGVRNSTDKCFSAGVVFGTKVKVCSNLMFNGEVLVKHKHTTNIDVGLNQRLEDAILNLRSSHKLMDSKIEYWKDRTMSEDEFASFMWKVGNTGVLPFSFLKNRVSPLYEKPLYSSHNTGKVWTLHNAFSEAMKERNTNNPQSFNLESQAVIKMLDLEFAA